MAITPSAFGRGVSRRFRAGRARVNVGGGSIRVIGIVGVGVWGSCCLIVSRVGLNFFTEKVRFASFVVVVIVVVVVVDIVGDEN